MNRDMRLTSGGIRLTPRRRRGAGRAGARTGLDGDGWPLHRPDRRRRAVPADGRGHPVASGNAGAGEAEYSHVEGQPDSQRWRTAVAAWEALERPHDTACCRATRRRVDSGRIDQRGGDYVGQGRARDGRPARRPSIYARDRAACPARNLPLYSQDHDGNYPPAAVALKDAIHQSQAILFVTPEYNRSIPGGLKNAIDWASRPWGQNAFDHVPTAMIGASIGEIGTALAQQSLRAVLSFCNARQMTAPEAYIKYTLKSFRATASSPTGPPRPSSPPSWRNSANTSCVS